jgi:hypothetical protein
MKNLPTVLFFSGLAIQLLALLGEHAEEIPFVLKRVAPSYFRAQAGIETLMKNRRLVNTDDGFVEISRFLLDNVDEINGRPKGFEIAHKVKLESISSMGESRQENTAHGDVLYIPDDIRYVVSAEGNHFIDSAGHFQHALEFHYHLPALQKQVDELKTPNVLFFCFGMFLIGSIVEVAAFFWEKVETEATGQKVNEHKYQPPESCKTTEQEQPTPESDSVSREREAGAQPQIKTPTAFCE